MDSAAPTVRLGDYEGPLDLLLDLARAQRVDLAAISVRDLATQFAAAIMAATPAIPLSRRGDWAVAACWLLLLKSRLLLPADPAAAAAAEADEAAMRSQLAELAAMRAAAAWLEGRPRLGCDVHGRGAAHDTPRGSDFYALFQACVALLAVGQPETTYAPPLPPLFRVAAARERLRAVLAANPLGAPLPSLLPAVPATVDRRPLLCRSAVAATLLAALELTREGEVDMTQTALFAMVTVSPKSTR
jgi:segregation and condensation protein A